jgi:hypothetical protein
MDSIRHNPRRRSSVVMAGSVSYVECDIPDDATLREWRRSHAAGRPARARVWRRVVRRVAAA